MRRAWLLTLALGLLALSTASLPARAATSTDPTSPEQPDIALVTQTSFVTPGGTWTMRLRPDPSALSPTTQLVVTPFRAVGSRSEFVLTLSDRIIARQAAAPRVVATEGLVDATGLIDVSLPIQDPAEPRDPERLDLGGRDGVFPVRVLLQEADGAVLDRFVTHIVYLPEERLGAELGVSLVIPVESDVATDPGSDTTQLSDAEASRLAALVDALAAGGDLAYTLVPRAETVTVMSPATRTTLAGLARARHVVSGSYVDVDAGQLVAAGLEQELDRQLTTGFSRLRQLLGSSPDQSTAVARSRGQGGPGLDQGDLDALHERGASRVIVAETDLVPIEQRLSTTRPFLLPIAAAEPRGGEPTITAALADSGLSAHFDNTRSPVLAAHQLVADLAVLYMDEPGTDRRGVVVMPGPERSPRAELIAPLLAALRDHPIIQPMTVDQLFQTAPLDLTRSGAELVRQLVAGAGTPPSEPGPAAVADGIRRARVELDSLASVVGSPDGQAPVEGSVERVLLAQARGLSLEQRRAHLARVTDEIRSRLDLIKMPAAQSITITARRAQIPLTLQNGTGGPVRVVLKVDSDKLDFPEGSARVVDLDRLNTTARVPVVARTSGAFPLDVVLESPDGNLVIGEARITVNSTAASRLSLVVFLGAAGFLAIWWGRQLLRERRQRTGRVDPDAG